MFKNRIVLGLLVIAVASSSFSNAQDTPAVPKQKAEDIKKMTGKWKVTKATMRGMDAPPAVLSMIFEFTADKKINLRGGPKDVDFKFDTELGKKYNKIMFEATTGTKAGKKAIGFYKFDKDMLHLHMPNQPNADDPPTAPSKDLPHFVLERVPAKK